MHDDSSRGAEPTATAPPVAQSLDRELQRDWDWRPLHESWPMTPDARYLMARVGAVPVETTAAGASGRLLEVAAAEAVHACRLNLRGLTSVVLEPSQAMLELARGQMARHGARLELVRGVAETMPFRDASFDRVLCDAAIDHFADPAEGIREMARVLAPDGRLVITYTNYSGVAVRVSRTLYRLARALRLPAASGRLYWDTPVPFEHTFECTPERLQRLCAPYLALDETYGVSLGGMVPLWGRLLEQLPEAWTAALLERIDAIARRRPGAADFVVSVWRRRPDATFSTARTSAATPDGYVVAPDDLVYPVHANREKYWSALAFGSSWTAVTEANQRWTNRMLTGDAARTWFDDLLSRGPFERAAMLGIDDTDYERQWVERRASARLDVYELSDVVLERARARMGLTRSSAADRRVRFISADLNFAHLPERRYDVIWSSNCLHHIANLEHLFAAVAAALRPGGLFVIHDYVGEPRMRYGDARLRLINALLAEIPERFRNGATEITAPPPWMLSPFCGVRPDAIVPLAEARFDVVHKAVTERLFPLRLMLDIEGLERERPDILARIRAAEEDPTLQPCGAYLVLRKRAAT